MMIMNMIMQESRIPLAVDDIEFIDEGKPVFLTGSTARITFIPRPMTAVNSRL